MEYILKVPKIGEVDDSVTIVKYYKAVGDFVEKDEMIATLETNKAALDIESPVAGKVEVLPCVEGDTLLAGQNLVVLSISSAKTGKETVSGDSTTNLKSGYISVHDENALRSWLNRIRNRELSPREKAYCRSRNVIPISTHKDFQRQKDVPPEENYYYVDRRLSKSQTRLAQTLIETAKQVVPANIQLLCDNSPIETFRRSARKQDLKHTIPSRLEIIAWAVSCAMREHAAFCSKLMDTNSIRQFKNPNLGIAVALDHDELTTAVIPNIFSYDFHAFVNRMRTNINEARDETHVVTYHSLVISDLSTFGVINAVPVVAYPTTATLFIGRPYFRDGTQHFFNMSLSFDHRHINGAGAAAFLNDIRKSMSRLDVNLLSPT